MQVVAAQSAAGDCGESVKVQTWRHPKPTPAPAARHRRSRRGFRVMLASSIHGACLTSTTTTPQWSDPINHDMVTAEPVAGEVAPAEFPAPVSLFSLAR